MRLMAKNSRLKAFSTVIILILIFDLIGCEAFVKKFTRKSKKEDKVEEMVLAPEEYRDTRSKEQIYREYFDFWKSWQTELVESLLQKKSNKKQVSCAQEAIKNLSSLRDLLSPEKQKKLDVYINQMKSLMDSISGDTYGANTSSYMEKAEALRMNILRDFSYKKVSKDISYGASQ